MEVEVRRARHALYLRLAAVHAGPLGPALLGHPELAPLYPKAYAACGGAEGLACAGVGGEPRVCVVRRLAHLAKSALRGGRRRREQEKAMVEGLLLCMAHLQREFPPEFSPVLQATQEALRKDLRYLRGELSPEEALKQMVHPPQDQHQGHGSRGQND
ncbi:hypothetical protein TCCBUS3UF1_3380 [Thermus sp. CCB_US3_UF1]|uniref:hypothetical protein n=1 Tax=Thermus sp. CCB_US3_UF1 TaxID=1111069 RepID=UPI0002389B96|nr:hypothetical protein [Thermus sp. CCB_US3_UF1]AEV15386.1 hypothetical protein TCCBUS3UF1_3380 [Thermus sp. CCB_US3_UF1]